MANVENELMHYGVLGMKWGIRRYQNADGSYTNAGKKRYIADKTKGIRQDIASFKGHEKGVFDKKGRLTLSADDVKQSVQGLQKVLAKQETKHARNWDIHVTKQKIDNLLSMADKIIYNDATRRAAARYVVQKNMSVDDALKKAKTGALINSAIYVAACGAITVAQVVARRG